MKTRILALLVVILISTSAFAVIKELVSADSSLVKVGDGVVVPIGAEVQDAVSIGGNVTVFGKVTGSAVSVGGNVLLKESAKVEGDAVAVGGMLIKEPGAVVKGSVVEVAAPGLGQAMVFFTNGGMAKGLFFFKLLTFIGFIVLAMIMVVLFVEPLGKVSGMVETNLLRSFLIGTLVFLLFLPVIFILMISLIGIMIIPLWVLLVGLAAFFGYFGIAHLLGKKTLNAFKIYNKPMMVETLTGVTIL
ncbi:MAG: polymer-forming cytoskeletal protein, partial [Candidatus Margulisiibacteriota bacterium]